ncbi:MAG: peptidase M48, partial [Bacteroidia bacterium]|nr:peptidase M48 [Bacteroidia bacterium]
AGFFEKLQSEKKGTTVPEFLSTHPSDKTRIEAIYAECAKLDMSGKRDFEEEYKEFKEKYLK